MNSNIQRTAYIIVVTVIVFMKTISIESQERKPVIIEPAPEIVQKTIIQSSQNDKTHSLHSRVIEKPEPEFCVREQIVFSSTQDHRVPGYLAIPKAGRQPFPCILLLPYQEASKSSGWEKNSEFHYDKLTAELLTAGYAICVIDALYHGERSAENDYSSPGLSIVANGLMLRYRDMVIQSTVDNRVAIDYLTTRPEIDTERIGVIGMSMGGMMTFTITATDPRINVAVAGSVPTSGPWVDSSFSASAVQNYTMGIGNRPFLLLMGRKETRFLPEEAENLYNHIPSQTKNLRFYDCGHFFTEEYIDDTIEWFKKHL